MAALVVMIWISNRGRDWTIGCGPAVILLAQTFWLLREPTDRAASILAGIEPPPAPTHVADVVLEVIKLACENGSLGCAY